MPCKYSTLYNRLLTSYNVSKRALVFLRKCVSPAISFSFGTFCTGTRFKTTAKGTSFSYERTIIFKIKGGGFGQFPKLEDWKKVMQRVPFGKIEQVLSFIHILCLTLKKLSQAIAYPKNHVQPKGDKNISCPENSKDWDNQFSKKKFVHAKNNDLFELKNFTYSNLNPGRRGFL